MIEFHELCNFLWSPNIDLSDDKNVETGGKTCSGGRQYLASAVIDLKYSEALLKMIASSSFTSTVVHHILIHLGFCGLLNMQTTRTSENLVLPVPNNTFVTMELALWASTWVALTLYAAATRLYHSFHLQRIQSAMVFTDIHMEYSISALSHHHLSISTSEYGFTLLKPLSLSVLILICLLFTAWFPMNSISLSFKAISSCFLLFLGRLIEDFLSMIASISPFIAANSFPGKRLCCWHWMPI